MTMEQIAGWIGTIVAAIVAAVVTARRTTNGITGNIESHLKPSENDRTTLRVAVDEIRENVSRVLRGQDRSDERLLQTERRIEDHLDDQDYKIEEQGKQIKGVADRVTVLEKWKQGA